MIGYEYHVENRAAIEKIRRFAGLSAKYIFLAVSQSQDVIGQRAVGDHMKLASYDSDSNTIAPRGSKDEALNIRTGRLARSIGAQADFSASGTGSREHYRKVVFDGSRFVAKMGSNVPYAAVHEFGYSKRITKRQRGFFWYKYYETKNEMWLALALSERYNIPARPYLGPAADASGDDVRRIFRDRILERIEEGFDE